MKCALLLLAACSGNVGTVAVTLVTAPGSHVLDTAQTLELVLTNPHQVTTATRSGDGFSIELELPAQSVLGQLIVDALDGSGALVATGASPTFPVGGIDAKMVIYMAAPNTIGAAPVGLATARDPGVAALSFGVVFAGGHDAANAPTTAIEVYNAFDHTIASGMPLPAPRSDIAIGVGGQDAVYLFGGHDASAPTATLWKFVTNVAPSGAYIDLGTKAGFERRGEHLLPLGNDQFLVTGAPAAQLAGLAGTVTTRTEIPSLPHAGATVVASDGVVTSIFVGASGVVRFRNGAFELPSIAGAARDNAAVAALPGGKVLIACGAGGAIRLDAATLAVEMFPNIPATPRTGCAIGTTGRHVLIASDATAEIFDATTLAPVATQPLAIMRSSATAVALPTDQILIAGGAVTDLLELFTPAPTE